MLCVACRPLCPGDEDELQRLHAALFPLNYEMVFFQKAARGHDNIFSWAALQTCAIAAMLSLAQDRCIHLALVCSASRASDWLNTPIAAPTANRDASGRERGMMGFITARMAVLAEADPADRKLMRLDSPSLDKEPVVYLLTIGTVPTLQRKVRWR
jgi:hypothetical protein